MFTGIVEEIGVVAELNPHDATGGTSLTISLPAGSTLLSDCHDGDSIAVNGVCLTVTSFSARDFSVGVAPETLRVTDLGGLVAGSRVNLERAVRADTRMGGHFVQGHVDATATIVGRRADGNAVTMRFKPTSEPEKIMKYVVRKGYVALDGTSLTVTQVDDAEGWWEVMLIVYTQERVVLAQKGVGDSVNVEVDVLAKYAEKSMAGYISSLGAGGNLEKIVQGVVGQGKLQQ
ncbi:riboflavin synthase [Magnaporthiopsis poae ATCC 64411]|uniref:Riboflavin synthase n=1 Tax=Magnaporthiopsis poae (strain ATCC 64411 / 73-15) TaxID=644358 RepID=A0A0C4DT59_MAGP6|nr:riboflavin synthase [Magnaporthiopsis poae ATCC 64411]